MIESEGDAWFMRNRDKIGLSDPVGDALEELAITPTSVLEVGAADGWRLAKLRDKYGCKIVGIDPSMAACNAAVARAVPMYQMTANGLPADDRSVDLLIYGFCLYLTDPDDWMRIASEGDRVLRDGGHIVVHDFADTGPYAKPYKHHPALLSYHFDFAQLWACHPFYEAVSRDMIDREWVTVLKKSTNAIPVWP